MIDKIFNAPFPQLIVDQYWTVQSGVEHAVTAVQ